LVNYNVVPLNAFVQLRQPQQIVPGQLLHWWQSRDKRNKNKKILFKTLYVHINIMK
jgi:hypothetical protein